MRIRIVEFEGSVEELEAVPEIRQQLSSSAGGASRRRGTKAMGPVELGEEERALLEKLPTELAEALKSRSRTSDSLRRLALILLAVQAWPHVSADLRASQKSRDGLSWMIRIRRHDGRKGAFVLVDARRAQLTFRLNEAVLANCTHAYAREVRAGDPFRVKLAVTSDEAVEEGVDLAKEAYEEASA